MPLNPPRGAGLERLPWPPLLPVNGLPIGAALCMDGWDIVVLFIWLWMAFVGELSMLVASAVCCLRSSMSAWSLAVSAAWSLCLRTPSQM